MQKKEILKETTKIPWPGEFLKLLIRCLDHHNLNFPLFVLVLISPDPEKTPKKSRDGRWTREFRGSENADEPDDPKKAHIINRVFILHSFKLQF